MMSSSDSDQSSIIHSFEANIKPCSWCKQLGTLERNKSYCEHCSAVMFRECIRCKLPYPDKKYFEKNDVRCNTCQLKYLKEKERREANRAKIQQKCSDPLEMTKHPTKRSILLNKESQSKKKTKLTHDDANDAGTSAATFTLRPPPDMDGVIMGYMPIYFCKKD
jgi:hypothetical protein